MSSDPELRSCVQCGFEFPQSQERCPRCGADQESVTPRRVWMRYFFIVLLGTPILTLGTALLNHPLVRKLFPSELLRLQPGFMAVWIAVGGALIAGYLLARARARKGGILPLAAFGYGVGILFVYGAIAFAGCVVAFRGF